MTEQSTDAVLKPCPFCGVELREVPMFGKEEEKVLVHDATTCVLELCRIPKDKITAWNTRTKPLAVTPEMVERVARAIHAARWMRSGYFPLPFEDERDVSYARDLARAALSAIGGEL